MELLVVMNMTVFLVAVNMILLDDEDEANLKGKEGRGIYGDTHC